jgi:ABC-type glycerol-3-phosphate transport system substrate-binding protein
MANVGSVWDLKGPLAAEAAQWVQDWLYKYRIADPAIRAWGDPQFMQELQFVIEGKTAMHGYGGATCAGAVDTYNQAVERGEIAGTKLEARLWSLPHPYNPANMPHEVYSVRPIYLQMMRQEPYKGDEHTENVAAFAKWFISTETQIRLCTEISTAPCPVPARKSVRDVVLTDPQRKADVEYMVARGKAIPQLSHPALATIQTQIWIPNVDRLFANDITGQEFVDAVAEDAQPLLDDWVNEASTEEAALVELWCKVPSWFPGQFYPNYTPPVSEACQAKLQELGIQ